MNDFKFVLRTLYREHGKGLRVFLHRHPAMVRATMAAGRGLRDGLAWLWQMPKPARAGVIAVVALWAVFSSSERVEAHSRHRFCKAFPKAAFCQAKKKGSKQNHLSVPELDPGAGGQAAVLLVGGVAVLVGRRRRVHA